MMSSSEVGAGLMTTGAAHTPPPVTANRGVRATEQEYETGRRKLQALSAPGERFKRRVQEAVVAEREQYRTLFELAPAAYLLTDTAGVIQEANRRAINVLGATRPVLIGLPLAVFVASEDRLVLLDRLNHVGGLEAVTWQLRLQPCRRDPVAVVALTGVARDQAGQITGLRWLLLELPLADQSATREPASPPSGAASLSGLDPEVADDGQFTGPTGPSHPVVVQAMRLLEPRLTHQWTLRELADQLHVSPSHLVRLFKSSTGMPPMAYVARRRVETAAGLLLHTDQPVTQIGRSVGWPDQNYFARRFKAHFGLSPSAYRSRFTSSVGRQPQALLTAIK
jgi:PAS domain S-box-containing protein